MGDPQTEIESEEDKERYQFIEQFSEVAAALTFACMLTIVGGSLQSNHALISLIIHSVILPFLVAGIVVKKYFRMDWNSAPWLRRLESLGLAGSMIGLNFLLAHYRPFMMYIFGGSMIGAMLLFAIIYWRELLKTKP